MEKKLLFIMALSTMLFAYVDSDMDGVDDALDKCPNTPLLELVDINGCTKKILIPKTSKHHFDFIVGANYAASNYASLNRTDTFSTSLQFDYYYKDFSLQASTSYYKTDGDNYSESGMNDSFIGIAYNIKPMKDLLIRVGLGAILPTYDTGLHNNNTDYSGSFNISYTTGKINLFGGYIYTMINDDDVIANNIEYIYEDTNAFNAGLGYYFTDKLYMSASYNSANSIYKGVEDVDTVSLYGYRSINKNWFLTFLYAYGLSESASDHSASVKLGYYF